MDNHVIVTGGTGGLGIPVLTDLLQKEWEITCLVRSQKSGEKLKKAFPDAYGVKLNTVESDLSSEKEVALAISRIKGFKAVVHLAGGFKGAPSIEEDSLDNLRYLVDINILPSFIILKNTLPVLKKQKEGCIIMIGAKPALQPSGINASYAASKAALANLVLSAAEEGRKFNVRANLIVPGVIDTASNRAWESDPSTVDKWTPPEDIAQTISWLISNKGKHITGAVIPMYNKMKTF